MRSNAVSEEFEIGYLIGLVDSEGYVFVHYTKNDDHTHPGLRIYCTSKPIIERASRIMDVNPVPRRNRGKLVGWIAAVQGKRAIETLRKIVPYMKDPSKKCRALTILKKFKKQVSIAGKHPSSEVFSYCPPLARLRARHTRLRENAIDSHDAERTAKPLAQQNSLALQVPTRTFNGMSNLQKGWLCGIVDEEGHIHIRYWSDRKAMYPRLRVFVKSRATIDYVAQLINVNPCARHSHGRQLGWYASVSHLKALNALRLIAPHLLDPSKKCRVNKILDAFGKVGSVHSRLITSEFFSGCPPPSRMRASRRIINCK